jgi:cyclopropane fatty-acyl-phospholipid synthase-like methyltransferase
VFTKNTVREVDFLIEELHLPSGGAILDVGCGMGRHAVELAKRGCAVTGLDLSSEMLSRAAAAAKAAGVAVEVVRSDATLFTLSGKYDAAVCLCEGAFGLLAQSDGPIDQPLSILCNISRSLKPKARALFPCGCGPRTRIHSNGAAPDVPRRRDVRAQHVGRDRRELGTKSP